MIVIGIIGPKASGKDTIARYIAEKYHGKNHSHSEILSDILDILSMEKSRENQIKLVALRDKFGTDVLMKALNKKIRNDNVEVEAITGIRFENEYENIRSYPNNKIIYIDSDVEVRYKRQLERNEKADDSTMTLEKFLELEEAVTEQNIRTLGEKADFKIFHNGSPEELYPKIDEILQGIL